MKVRFDPKVVYPSDDHGQYVELPGRIVYAGSQIRVHDYDQFPVTLDVGDDDEYSGFTGHMGSVVPKIGDPAVIRVYNAGGGWYPDNVVTMLARSASPDDGVLKLSHVRASGLRLCDYTEGMTMYQSELMTFGPPTCLGCAAALSKSRISWPDRVDGSRLTLYHIPRKA